MTPYSIFTFLGGSFSLLLGAFVFFKNRNVPQNRSFVLMCLSICVWLFAYTICYSTHNIDLAILLARIACTAVVFVGTTFYHFIVDFLGLKSEKKFVRVAYLLSFVQFPLFLFTNYLLVGVYKYFWGYYSKAGFFHPLFLLFFFTVCTRGILLLFFAFLKKKRGIDPIEFNQIRYVFFASIIIVLGSVDFIPKYGIGFYPFGFIFILIYMSITAYAIIRYRLMDIRIAVTRAGIFIFVYTLVLGIPFGLAGWGRGGLVKILGEGWFWLPMFLLLCLASAGPSIYLYLQRRAENLILREQRRYQRTLMELSKTMTRIRDLEQLLKAIVLTVVNTVKVSYAAVYLKDDEYKSYRLKHSYPKKEGSRLPEFIALDSSLIKVLQQQKRTLTQDEIGSVDDFGLDSGLVIPCFMEDDLLGFLILGAKQNNQVYTPDDIIVFEALSYATSLAIENSTFWKQIEERQRVARIEEMNLFSYSLAHEIDNPMTIIIGQAGKIKKAYLDNLNLSQEQKEELKITLDYISEAAWRVSGMVKAIQEFGQKTSSEFKPMQLEEAIENYLKLYTAHFKMNGVYFTKEVAQNLPMLRADKHGIEELFVILSNNAVHAVREVPVKKINLKVEMVNSDWIRIAFSDNGYGIAPDKIETIFAPFVTTKASSEGTGMGLYNAKNIISRHKGRIWAESEGAPNFS